MCPTNFYRFEYFYLQVKNGNFGESLTNRETLIQALDKLTECFKTLNKNNQAIVIKNEDYLEIKKLIEEDFKTLLSFVLMLSGEKFLPPDFVDWNFTINHLLETIARKAARTFTLPQGFNQWKIADSRGITVAHEFVLRGNFSISNIPPDWDWDLKDGFGNTVRDVYNASKIIDDYSIEV